MSNAPQNRPDQSKTAQVGNNPKKNESTAEKRTGGMKDEACSTAGNKASECSPKSSKI